LKPPLQGLSATPGTLCHPRVSSTPGSCPSQDLLNIKIFSIREMPRKSKGKEIATHKCRASTHDLRKVSTTVENASGSSKFSAVIKFSSGSSAKVTHAQEVTEGMTSDTQAMEAGGSSVALDNSPSAATMGSEKDTSGSPAGTPTIVSNSKPNSGPVAN